MSKKYEKLICLTMIIVMFFAGMCLEGIKTDSSFLCANVEEQYALDDFATCTMEIWHNGAVVGSKLISGSFMKWQGSAVLPFCIVGMFLRYLFYYQSFECKEDGQLLLCRSVAVKYIHQTDGEK